MPSRTSLVSAIGAARAGIVAPIRAPYAQWEAAFVEYFGARPSDGGRGMAAYLEERGLETSVLQFDTDLPSALKLFHANELSFPSAERMGNFVQTYTKLIRNEPELEQLNADDWERIMQQEDLLDPTPKKLFFDMGNHYTPPPVKPSSPSDIPTQEGAEIGEEYL